MQPTASEGPLQPGCLRSWCGWLALPDSEVRGPSLALPGQPWLHGSSWPQAHPPVQPHSASEWSPGQTLPTITQFQTL